jgi:hypothetical protein
LELIKEWKSIQQALNHRPFHPESDEYKRFLEKTEKRNQTFWKLKYNKEQGYIFFEALFVGEIFHPYFVSNPSPTS